MRYQPPASRTSTRFYLVYADAARQDVRVVEGPRAGYSHPDRLASEQAFDTAVEAAAYQQRVLAMSIGWKSWRD